MNQILVTLLVCRDHAIPAAERQGSKAARKRLKQWGIVGQYMLNRHPQHKSDNGLLSPRSTI